MYCAFVHHKALFMPVKITITLSLFIIATAVSCTSSSLRNVPETVTGYKAIYANNLSEVKEIYATTPQPTVKAGKMYVQGNLLFQVEKDSGIHVINIADRSNPAKISFIRSSLCKEVAIKNGYLYTNNLADLVVIDISDLQHISVKSRVENVFPDLALQSPPSIPNADVTYFECPDAEKGFIIGWETATLHQPKCWK